MNTSELNRRPRRRVGFWDGVGSPSRLTKCGGDVVVSLRLVGLALHVIIKTEGKRPSNQCLLRGVAMAATRLVGSKLTARRLDLY